MSTNVHITNYVVNTVAVWSGRSVDKLSFKTDLFDDLNLNPPRVRTLSGALRNFVQLYDEKETIRVRDIKKAKAIGPLVQVIIEKATGRKLLDESVKKLIAKSSL